MNATTIHAAKLGVLRSLDALTLSLPCTGCDESLCTFARPTDWDKFHDVGKLRIGLFEAPNAIIVRRPRSATGGVILKAKGKTMHPKAKEAVKRVLYEWNMLQRTYEEAERECDASRVGTDDPLAGIGTGNNSEKSTVVYALLESFLLHARVLRDFFCKSRDDKRTRADDLVAEDFFDNRDEWQDNNPGLGPYLTENKEHLDKALAHLTYTRIEYEKTGKLWDLTTAGEEIEVLWRGFLKALPEERRQWFLPRTIHEDRKETAVDEQLKAKLRDFLTSFELVFDNDWEFTESTLTDESREFYISPGNTFLAPGVEDESNNWANRGRLLASYRALRESLKKHGIEPEFGG